jgi:WD40 repeat protein
MAPRTLDASAAIKLRGHSDGVSCLAWLHGEEKEVVLATGSCDGTARVWNLGQHGAPARVMETGASVGCLAWSVDGKLLATGGGQGGSADGWGVAAVWSRDGGRVARLEGHTRTISVVQFSTSGRRVATTSYDGTCRVWEVATATCLQVVRAEDYAVAWRNEEEFFLVADNTILRCQVGEDEPVQVYTGHTDGVNSLAWDPRGGVLASGSYFEGTVRTWRPDSPSPALATLTGPTGSVEEVVWRPGKPGILASLDLTDEVRIWDAGEGICLHTLHCAPGEGGTQTNNLSFSPDGQLLAAGGGEVRVWKAETGELALVCRAEAEEADYDGQAYAEMVGWSPGGDRLAVASPHKDVIWVFDRNLCLKALAAQVVAACIRERLEGGVPEEEAGEEKELEVKQAREDVGEEGEAGEGDEGENDFEKKEMEGEAGELKEAAGEERGAGDGEEDENDYEKKEMEGGGEGRPKGRVEKALHKLGPLGIAKVLQDYVRLRV